MFKFSTEEVSASSSKFFYFIEMKHLLKTKQGLLHFFTAVSRPLLNIPKEYLNRDFIKVSMTEEEYKVVSKIATVFVSADSKLTDLDKVEPSSAYHVYGIIPGDNSILLAKLTDNGNVAPFHPFDRFNLTAGMIENYTDETPVVTDVGKFTVNYLLFADVFKDLIPYQNKKLSPGKTDDLVAEVIVSNKANREHYRKYMDQGYWFLENGGIFVSAFTEKALTTGPEVLAKKKELLNKYKDQLDNPDTLAKIEAELISMDKDYLKNDPADIFMDACGKKAYNEARKKMFLTFGMSQSFGTGGYKFTPNSLEDGWEAKYLATGANEVRRGSYGRGIETAKGGAESKFILRTFQETKIIEDNCFDNRGMSVTFTEDNVDFYVDRYLTNGTLITDENKKTLIGKTYKVRSPMTCKTKGGFCYQCCGEVFRKIQMSAIGMQTLEVTSSFTAAAMSTMHRSGISAVKIADISELIVK